MALILNIETTTEVCSVCVAKEGVCIALKESFSQNHASDLHVFIQQVLIEAGVEMKDIHAVAISSGPGSYTGLRIGWASAKGLCYAIGVPLISVSTLEALVRDMQTKSPGVPYYMPMLDARRMEVYTALYDTAMHCVVHPQAYILTDASIVPVDGMVAYGGSGAAKAQDLLTAPVYTYVPDIYCSAAHMAPVSAEMYNRKDFADVAYSEPFYLKEAKITASKKA